MQKIWAKQALMPDGWQNDVLVNVDPNGMVTQVAVGRMPSGYRTSVLLPAPTNLHSHSFQRAMAGLTETRGPDPKDSFWTWRKRMYAFLNQLTPEDIEAAAAFVQMEMQEAGYAAVAEFHYLHHAQNGTPYDDISELSQRIISASVQSGIGLTHLPVLYEVGGCDGRPLVQGQDRFGNDLNAYQNIVEKVSASVGDYPKDFNLGIAPHSLRAVRPQSLIEVQAMLPNAPFHMHLAEQIPEVDEVLHHFGARPVEWLLDTAEITDRWCLIHCTQMTPRETQNLAATGAVAGLCPITESSLGDGIFPATDYLAAGGRFGIGSDSNIRITLSEELRTLEYTQRLRDHSRAALATQTLSTGRRLFEECCCGGAQAAGRTSGKIAKGYLADLVEIDANCMDLDGLQGDVLLDTWIFAGDDSMVKNLWSAGRHQVVDGQHIAREDITKTYRKLQEKLRSVL